MTTTRDEATPESTTTTPAIAGLSSWPAERWREFANRLCEIELNETNLAPVTSVLPNMLPRLSLPMRRWFLRQQTSNFSYAARLLIYGDSISAKEAQCAFGGSLTSAMQDSGLVCAESDGSLVSPFRLNVTNRLFLLGDNLQNGGDAVMAVGNTTLALIGATDSPHLGRVLDLGCGAGAIALTLATHADFVIATDINPRACAFGRINAILNGITNVEFRVGDLYQPVTGEQFDLVVSQPPFIPMPEGSRPTTFLFGGPRGDELPSRVLEGASEHLREDGRAVILVQWPMREADILTDRVHSLVPSDVDVLLLTYPALDLNIFCLAYAGFQHQQIDTRFDADLMRWRNHLQSMGIHSLKHCYNVLRKRSHGTGWIHEVCPALGLPDSASISQLFARFELLSAGDEALLKARLRIRADAVLVVERTLANRSQENWVVQFRSSAMNRPAEINREMLALLKALDRSASVAEALQSYSSEEPSELLPAVREALELGLLEVRNEIETASSAAARRGKSIEIT